MYFTYGETELSYLRQKDKRLGEVIDRVGPVRRAVGAGGSLTGYAGGIDRKVQLLTLEHADTSGFFVPKKSTAP